ncbi:MAG TPA: L,D-transpeptidase [Lacibacter sp.]|nr:L,D-transpeptidase [Lacibacter sp.]HMO88140.1 L,D-transpeptidase [Lacibacter sp.]HMP86509.1 L,D-transpeptidase [Lacibacter sp.]
MNKTGLLFLVLFLSVLGTTAFRQGAAHRTATYPEPISGTPPYKVVIVKSAYELRLFDASGWLATYPVVFGSSELRDKMMEGDRMTPEGAYKIVHKKMHPEWGHFLLLDYPNSSDLEKFRERQRAGLIPAHARPGGGIGIHATRKNEDRFVDYFYNWTLGCISTKRSYARELYDLLPVGTEVQIQP